jgi:ABC-type oligopeptide transport system substrate-binding subunit
MPYALFEGRRVLASLGYPDGKGSPPLKILVEEFEGASALAEWLRRTWKAQLGLEVRYDIVSPSLFPDALRSRKYPLFVGRWGADFPDESNFYEVFLSRSSSNYTGWKSKPYDSQIKLARTMEEGPERRALYEAAEKLLLRDDVVIVPLFYKKNSVLLKDDVLEFELNPLNYLYFKQVQVATSTAKP